MVPNSVYFHEKPKAVGGLVRVLTAPGIFLLPTRAESPRGSMAATVRAAEADSWPDRRDTESTQGTSEEGKSRCRVTGDSGQGLDAAWLGQCELLG